MVGYLICRLWPLRAIVNESHSLSMDVGLGALGSDDEGAHSEEGIPNACAVRAFTSAGTWSQG
jgi:hypothetical protein